MKEGRSLAFAVIVAVVAAVAVGLWLIGSPTEARARRFDDRRIEDLQRLAATVDLYWQQFDRLPVSLTEAHDTLGNAADSLDPSGDIPYSYQAIDTLQYQLCAHFDRPSDERDAGPSWPGIRSWRHGVGLHCFRLTPPRKP